MHCAYPRLLRVGLSVLAAGLACCSVASPQAPPSERGTVLAALTLSYGPPVDKRKPFFVIAPDYVLTPVFSSTGLLIRISIEPKSNSPGRDPGHPVQLSKSEFEIVLANLDSIKPMGNHEEDLGAIVHGWRAWETKRYQNAYLRTAELIGYGSPRPVEFAYIYYLHPVTGIARLPRGSNPQDAGSFGLVCVGGEPYIAPKAEFMKLQSNPFEPQTVELAGPTNDTCGQLP